MRALLLAGRLGVVCVAACGGPGAGNDGGQGTGSDNNDATDAGGALADAAEKPADGAPPPVDAASLTDAPGVVLDGSADVGSSGLTDNGGGIVIDDDYGTSSDYFDISNNLVVNNGTGVHQSTSGSTVFTPRARTASRETTWCTATCPRTSPTTT